MSIIWTTFTIMENNFKKERAELEEDMKNYQNEINLLDNQIHISDYVNVFSNIKYLESKLSKLDERIEKSMKTEELFHSFLKKLTDLKNITCAKKNWKNFRYCGKISKNSMKKEKC